MVPTGWILGWSRVRTARRGARVTMRHMPAATDALRSHLRGVVGGNHVLDEPGLRAPYETDWTRRWTGQARLVVRPGDTAEVAAVLRHCSAAGVPVVPQGGNTGLVGGGVPRGGEVVLSLTRLAGIDEVDASSGQVTVGAGATLAAVQAHARRAGWAVGVDLAARDSATIGGMVATNAGGVHVLRHGMMRANVAGAEAVLADGRVLGRLGGLLKDNTGYDLTGLLCGSEGTLAVVTRVRLRLVPRHDARVTALLGLPSLAAAVDLLPRLRHHVRALDAVEYLDGGALDLVRARAGLAAPLPARHAAYLVVEAAAGGDTPQDAVTAELAAALAGMEHVAVAVDRTDRDALWAYRERVTECVNAAGVPRKLDVTVPVADLPAFEPALRARLAEIAPSAALVLFGHLADGNLHVNLLGVQLDRDVDGAVYDLVAAFGGSISAEHGIGVAKRPWLHLTRSPTEITAMGAVKAAFDPAGILNPGVLLP
jgi:FAD/FMN-containing dehydrogenase